jgi:glycosyltransferase involved in cell wall biosynthesis
VSIDVVHVLPHAHTLGGTERTVLDLLTSPYLTDIDQRVVFVQDGPVASFPPALVLNPRGRGWGRPPTAALAIAKARPQIIHGWLLQGNLAGAAARVLCPSASLVTSERNLGHALTPAKRRLERFAASFESVATANSPAVRDAAIKRLPLRERRMQVILPGGGGGGGETANEHPKRGRRVGVLLLGVAPPPPPPHTVPTTGVMVSRLHPVKDHPTALRAWRLVHEANPGAVLTIVGDGPERSELEGLCRSLGLEDVVRFVGQTDPLPHLFGAQVYLSTSRAEGFSRSLLEALLAGIPAVVSAVGGTAEIPPGVLHIVQPGDDRAVAAALEDVLHDVDAHARAGQMASVVADQFSPDRCHGIYRRLYRELGVS